MIALYQVEERAGRVARSRHPEPPENDEGGGISMSLVRSFPLVRCTSRAQDAKEGMVECKAGVAQ